MKKFFALTMLAVSLILGSCSGGLAPIKGEARDLNIVANSSGKPIYLEEVRYFAHNFKLDMEQKYGEGIFKQDEYKALLKEKVEQAMLKNVAFLSLCDEYGIDINDKETKEYVSEYINNFAEELGGKSEYIEQLSENGMTDHLLRHLISIEASGEKLRQAMLSSSAIDGSDEKAREVIESDDFIRTLHIFIRNDEGDSIEENRKKAESVLEKLNAGEPFNRMIGRNSEDIYMTTTDGYYFMRGEYEKAYEDAAFALSENEYSGVVESNDGFYIILRLPKEKDYIEKNFESLRDRYIYVMFENTVDARVKEMSLDYTDYGKTLDFASLD